MVATVGAVVVVDPSAVPHFTISALHAEEVDPPFNPAQVHCHIVPLTTGTADAVPTEHKSEVGAPI
jgi:hypothetical protein